MRIDEEIVREYFEGNGFLVRRVDGSLARKNGEETVTLLVHNPRVLRERKPGFLVFASELPFLESALIIVKRWRSGRVTSAMLKSSAKLFRFIEQHAGKREPWTEAEGRPRILVLPGHPIAEPFRTQTIELLRARGIDGILSFRSMLAEVVERVEVARDYPGSAPREVIRVLKNYDFLKDSQMELFRGKNSGT